MDSTLDFGDLARAEVEQKQVGQAVGAAVRHERNAPPIGRNGRLTIVVRPERELLGVAALGRKPVQVAERVESEPFAVGRNGHIGRRDVRRDDLDALGPGCSFGR